MLLLSHSPPVPSACREISRQAPLSKGHAHSKKMAWVVTCVTFRYISGAQRGQYSIFRVSHVIVLIARTIRDRFLYSFVAVFYPAKHAQFAAPASACLVVCLLDLTPFFVRPQHRRSKRLPNPDGRVKAYVLITACAF